MDMFIIYDNVGYVLTSMSTAFYVPIGIPSMWVNIPTGKRLKNINTTVSPNVPVFEDELKSETQLLQDKVTLMQTAIDDLILGGAL